MIPHNMTSPVVHLVDDDDSFLRAVNRLLTVAGFTVLTFDSAQDFFERRLPTARGCVIVDLRMPKMTGLDFQKALAADSNPLPVIFLTGHGNIATSVLAMKGGAEDFLTKPVEKSDLLRAVERALARDAEMCVKANQQREILERFNRLTPREREVLALILAGQLNKEMAVSLATSERTIKAHRAAIMEKMQVQTPAELGYLMQRVD